MNIDRQRISAVRALTEMAFSFDGNEWKAPTSPASDKVQACASIVTNLRSLLQAADVEKAISNLVRSSSDPSTIALGRLWQPAGKYTVICHHHPGNRPPDLEDSGVRFIGPAT
jgi:hypothetical protein